jgi:hypothetical protein
MAARKTSEFMAMHRLFTWFAGACLRSAAQAIHCAERRARVAVRKSLRTRPAQMLQSCARLAAQVQFTILEDALFIFLLAICSLVLLSEFFDGDV